MAILPIILLIFIATIGVFAWSNMFDNLFNNTAPANNSVTAGSFQLAKTGAITFDTLISPIPILLAILFVAVIGLFALTITRKTRF